MDDGEDKVRSAPEEEEEECEDDRLGFQLWNQILWTRDQLGAEGREEKSSRSAQQDEPPPPSQVENPFR